MKKRLLVLVLALTIIISGVSVYATSLEELTKDITKVTDITDSQLTSIKEAVKEKFTDYDKSGWYATHVAKLVAVKGITGYPDKTFKPNGTITRAEFSKILIASLKGIQDQTDESHWATGYIDKAVEIGILAKNEMLVNTLDKPITRQEIAKMIILASEKSLSETPASNLTIIENMVGDRKTIGETYKNYVYSAYSKGIITGYSDKTFRPTNTATRAEASTMIVRLFDKKERIVPGEAKWETVTINGYVLPTKESNVVRYDTYDQEMVSSKGFPEVAFMISLASVKMNIPDQYTAVEEALKSQFDATTVKAAMDYIKLKTVESYVLEEKKIYSKGKYIRIASNYNNSAITVEVCYK